MKNHSIGFINGNIITMDKEDDRAEAVLIEKGEIVCVGSTEEVKPLADKKQIPIMDLHGATVLPGFHDCHVHVMGTGLASMGADLYDCSNVKEVLDVFILNR